MKYRDLTAVKEIGRDVMAKVVGGESFGQNLSDRILFFGEGRADLPIVKFLEGLYGVTNLGQLIQANSDDTGFPGNNTAKVGNGTDLPPGLPPGN